MSGTALLLLRHAESVWNAEGRWQGQADPPLSPRGREQARAAAPRLAGRGVEVVVASDLRRAAETADLLAGALGLEVRLDPRLRELHVGAWSGLPHAEIAARWPRDLARFRAGDPDVRPGGGESRRALRARVAPCLDEWAARHPIARVAVVTHGGVIRVLTGERVGNAEDVRLAWPCEPLREGAGLRDTAGAPRAPED